MNSVMEMVTRAKAEIENLSPDEVADELRRGDVLLVDLREPSEIAGGHLAGATFAPRGMLEFHADSATPYHLDGFREDRRVILYCGSGARSALAARSLQQLGYRDVAHLDGGYKAWIAAGQPVRT